MAARSSAVFVVVRGLWYLFLLLVVVPFALFAAAQTQWAKDWLAEQISAAASSPDATLTIDGIGGVLPVDMTVASVSMADADGTWLTASDVALRWSPAALFTGTLHVDYVGAKEVTVLRSPAGAEETDEPLALESPVAVVIDQVDFPHVVLAEPVAGVEAIFGAGGALGLDIESGILTVALEAARKDGVAGSAKLNADYALEGQRATFDLLAKEPAGGIVAGLIGLPAPAAVKVAAQGTGTLDAWAGTVAARIEGYATVDADVSLGIEDHGHRLSVDATGDVVKLVAVFAPEVAPLVEPGVTLNVAGMRALDGALTLDRLEAASGPTRAGLSGRFDPASGATDVEFDAQIDRVTDLFAPEATPLVADGVTGGFAGTVADVIVIDRADVASGPTRVSLRGQHALATGATDVQFDAEVARVAEIFAPEAAPLVADGIAGLFVGTVADVILIDQAEITAGPTHVSLRGEHDPSTGAVDYAFDADVLRAAEIFAPEAAPLVADGVTGAFAGTVVGGEAITIDSARVAAGPVEAEARGAVDLAAATVGLDFDLALAGLHQLAALAGMPLEGDVTVTGRVDGPIAAVALSDGTIVVTDFVTEAAAFDRFEGTLAAAPDGTWTDADLRAKFSGDGFVSGLTIAGQEPVLAALADERIDWRVAGTAQPLQGLVDLSEFSLASDVMLVGGTASVGGDGAVATSAVVQLDALERFADLAGVALRGRLQSIIDVTGDLTHQSFDVAIDGGFDDLRTGIQAADIALGARPTIATTMQIAETGGLTIRALTVQGAALSITGAAALGADQALAGDIRVTMPDLAPFTAVAGSPLAGALVLDAQPSGTVAAPAIDLAFNGSDLVFGDTPSLALVGTASGRDLLAAPQGAVAVRATADGVEARLASAYVLTDNQLRLSALEAEAVGLSVAGDMLVDLDTTLISGQVTGQSTDLAPAASLAGLDLGGALDFDAALAARDGVQAVTVTADAQSLTLPDADAAIGRAAIEADGTLDALDVKLSVKDTAVAGRAIALDGDANIALAENATRITVNALRAVVDTIPIALTKPARVVQEADRIGVSDLSVRVAEGTIEGDADLRPDGARADITMSGIALAPFRPGAEGTVDATLTLSGTAPHPDAELALAVRGFRDVGLAGEDVPPLNAKVDARWGQGALTAEAELTGPKDARVHGAVSMPLALAPDTFAAVLQDDAPITGQIDGQAELAEFAPLFLSDLDRLAGQLAIDVQIAGTLAAPAAQGQLAITGGEYENGLAGTVLTDLNLEVTGDGQEIVLRRLVASDGGGGAINGSGRVGLDADQGFPADLEVNFANFLAVRRPDAEVPLNGTMSVTGTMADYAVVGRLTVPQAEIRIPERLPANVVALDVIEVGGDLGAISPEAGSSAARAAPAPSVTLDITVDMPGRVFVRGRGLTSEWRGAVQVSGPAEEPVVEGGLTLVQGNFDLVGKNLKLEKGTVTLLKEDPGNPEIEALATTDLDDGIARIEITGTTSAPDIALSAEPAMPEDEVLSRLLFGSSVSSLSPVQAVQLANGVATLSGQGSGLGMLDEMRQATGVDVLDVRSNGETAADTSVRAGKYLADDVLLYIEQGARPGSSKATLEVELNDYLSVETDIGADSQGAVGVNIKTDY